MFKRKQAIKINKFIDTNEDIIDRREYGGQKSHHKQLILCVVCVSVCVRGREKETDTAREEHECLCICVHTHDYKNRVL